MKEPYIQVKTIDYSELSKILDDSLNTGIVINSDCGPVKITKVNNMAEFIKYYFVNNQLSISDDVTIHHAAKLLQFTPIYITRAFDNSVISGITNLGEVIYTDLDYRPFKFRKEVKINYTPDISLIVTENGLDYIFQDENHPEEDEFDFYSRIPSVLKVSNTRDKFEVIYPVYPNTNPGLLTNSTNVTSTIVTNSYRYIKFNNGRIVNNGDYVIIDGYTYYPKNHSGSYIGVLDPVDTFSRVAIITSGGIRTKVDLYYNKKTYSFITRLANDPNDVLSVDFKINNSIVTVTHTKSTGAITVSRFGKTFNFTMSTPNGKSNDINNIDSVFFMHLLYDKLCDRYSQCYGGMMHHNMIYFVNSHVNFVSQGNTDILINNDEGDFLLKDITVKKYIFDGVDPSKIKDAYIRIGDYVFYTGKIDENIIINPNLTVVKLSDNPMTYNQFLRSVIRNAGDIYDILINNSGDGFFIYNYINVFSDSSQDYLVISGSPGFDESLFQLPYEEFDDRLNNARFAIINKNPSRAKLLQYILSQSKDDSDIYNLGITYKSETINYEISFTRDKVNGNGRSIYYTYVNELNEYIHILELNSDILPSPEIISQPFGNEVPISQPEPDDYSRAFERFLEPEGVYYDFLFDAGYVNSSVARTIYKVATEIYAQGLITLENNSDPSQLILARNETGIERWQCKFITPWIPDTTVADFLIWISPLAIYLEKIYSNKDSSKEFAPLFGPNNSIISYNVKTNFTKDQRELLLDNQINTIFDDKSIGGRYFNLDLTSQKVDSSLSDGNNVRMINIGAHIADNAMKFFIGKFNTVDTRKEVTEILTLQLQRRLQFNQLYPLYNFKVVCNESNNPVNIIENRELVVDILYQFTPGIRYIKVYQKIYKLSQDINTAS